MKPLVLLLEPPLYDCRAPHLGCALLTAALRGHGYDVAYRDLNLDAILWLLEPQRLNHSLAMVGNRFNTLMSKARSVQRTGGTLPPEERHALWRSLKAMRYNASNTTFARNAVDMLRAADTFFNPTTHRAARSAIDAALDLEAFACDPHLHVGLCPQNYNGPHRATSLNDMLAASRDRTGNIFLPFFEEQVLPWASASRPLLAGVSISNVFQVIPGITLAGLLRDHGLFVVIGGAFFSKFASRLADRPEFFDLCDVVAVGEGEETLLHLAHAKAQGTALSEIPNIIYRSGGEAVATPIRFSHHLPDFGTADFRSLPLGDYLTPRPVLPIHAGKGCSWSRCTFCEIPQINTDFNRFRRDRRPGDIVRDMQIQLKRHGARHFIFTDESLPLPLLSGIADEILCRELEVNYIGYTRFSPDLDNRLCAKLARSGCRKLLFGLESGSAEVNRKCRKGVDLDQVPGIVAACQQSGIAVHLFTIVGLPGEETCQLEESAAYLLRLSRMLDLPVSTLDVSAFYLNWNSWLRRNAEKEKIRYRTDQDFPLHVDDYTLAGGMDSQCAKSESARIYSHLCWESSELGFDIGYFNPVWPGWEEYTLLYLSEYPNKPDRRWNSWPADRRTVLDKTVRVADGLTAREIPFSLEALALGTCQGPSSFLALSPSSQVTEIDPWAFRIITAKPNHTVAALLHALNGGAASTETARDPFSDIAQWIRAGILQW